MKPPKISKPVAKVLDEQKTNQCKLLMNAKEIDKMKDYDLTHEHGGNSFVVVEWLDSDYYRVAPISQGEIRMRAFLAWGGQAFSNAGRIPASTATDPRRNADSFTFDSRPDQKEATQNRLNPNGGHLKKMKLAAKSKEGK